MKHLHGFVAAGCLGLAAAFGASDAGSSPVVQELTFECSVKSSNDGCEKIVSCPSGTKTRAARAACNLEHGSITDEQLSSVARGYLEVVRSSDHVDEAACWVGSSRAISGQVAIAGSVGLTRVSV